eukprot:m.134027 g.134027  ORF g.134027 m.134027 type:complete len:71 (-) comp13952_c0_seq2:3316-3528(-)
MERCMMPPSSSATYFVQVSLPFAISLQFVCFLGSSSSSLDGRYLFQILRFFISKTERLRVDFVNFFLFYS